MSDRWRSCCAAARVCRDGLVIPDAELVERFSRSSGPGGQSVNTTDSRVELRWDVARRRRWPTQQRARLLERLAARLADGVLSHRRLRAALAAAEPHRGPGPPGQCWSTDALAPPPPARRPTRPSRAARQRRLEAKRQRGAAQGQPAAARPWTEAAVVRADDATSVAPRTAATRSASASTARHTAGGSGANASTASVSFVARRLCGRHVPTTSPSTNTTPGRPSTGHSALCTRLVRHDQIAVARLQVRVERAEQAHQLRRGRRRAAPAQSAGSQAGAAVDLHLDEVVGPRLARGRRAARRGSRRRASASPARAAAR